MKFEIEFTKKLVEAQAEFKFNYLWKSKIAENSKNLIIGIFFTSLGFTIVYFGKSNWLFLIFALGFYFLINSVNFFYLYNKTKNEYRKLLKNETERLTEGNLILELSEEFIKLENTKLKVELRWDSFKNYQIVNEYFLLFLKNSDNPVITVGKNEIGEDNFVKFIGFVNKKVKNSSLV